MEDNIGQDEKQAGQRAEELFREYCDAAGITYLYIHQSEMTKSSKLIRQRARRPDYIVVEPYKLPVFFDVKSHSFRTRDGKTANFFLEDKNYEAIFFSIDVFLQHWSFQNNVGMPVWLAWFERVGAVVRPERMLVCPLSVVSRFWMPISSLKWHFIQIPIRCCHSIDVKAGDPLAYKIDEREIEKHVSAVRRYAEERY